MRKLLPVVAMATLMISCKKNNDNPNEVNPTDKNFIIQTYLAAGTEIEAGQLAIGKSNDPAVKNFGKRIVADYTSAQADLRAVADEINFTLTDTLLTGTQSLSSLTGLSGYSFDTAYLKSRARSHLQLLKIFQTELNEGNNTYVRYYYLNKYIDKVRNYYQEADSLSRAIK